MSSASKEMELESITLSEISQTSKVKIVCYLWKVERKKKKGGKKVGLGEFQENRRETSRGRESGGTREGRKGKPSTRRMKLTKLCYVHI